MMTLELIPADSVVSGRKKRKVKKSSIDDKIKITKKSDRSDIIDKADTGIKIIDEHEKIDDKVGDAESCVGSKEDDVSVGVIIKRIHFPGSTYSNNQVEFKKIIRKAGLSWVRHMMKTYYSRDGGAMLTGVYESDDESKRVFCTYEGTGKPATMFVKVMMKGDRGKDSVGIAFLKELEDFCKKVGCVYEDKDEIYMQRVLSHLHEYGNINLPEPKDEETEKAERIEFEKKVNAYIEKQLDVYIDYYKDLFDYLGINKEVARYFRRRDIEKEVAWAVEHGFVKV